MIGKASPLTGRLAEIDTAMKVLQKDGTFTSVATVFADNNNTSSSECLCDCGKDE